MGKDNNRTCRLNEHINIILLIMFISVSVILSLKGCCNEPSINQQQEQSKPKGISNVEKDSLSRDSMN